MTDWVILCESWDKSKHFISWISCNRNEGVLMAADIEDAIGATEQIFGDNANSVNAWASKLDSSFGIAKRSTRIFQLNGFDAYQYWKVNRRGSK